MIEYQPREPRVHMSYDSVARTLLGIEKMGLPNVGILLDFGHSLYGGESPADAAQLAIDHGRLFGLDVNDNFRSRDAEIGRESCRERVCQYVSDQVGAGTLTKKKKT